MRSTPAEHIPSFSKGQLIVLLGETSHRSGWRRVNGVEYQCWLDSPDSKGFNDAGESKLGPTDTFIKLVVNRPYEVIRARCSAVRGYGALPACVELQCFATGERFFAKRSWFKAMRKT